MIFEKNNPDAIPHASTSVSRRPAVKRHHSHVAMKEVKVFFQILPDQIRPFSGYNKSLICRPRRAISLDDHDAIGQRREERRHGVVDFTPPGFREGHSTLVADGEQFRRIEPGP